MADAVVERRPAARFFCHRCNIEFEDVLQDYICPFCASGFIEQLGNERDGSVVSGDDASDADISMDDSDDIMIMNQNARQAVLNDLAFLTSGRRLRGNQARPEGLLEQLVWSIGGGAPGGAVTAGAPLVLVGTPGDYVFGGEGLDAVVTQLLGQLENSGPAPLTRDQIAAIPSVEVTAEQCAADASCSVCWDTFQQGEKVSRLECEHIFHPACIEPWLRLHATCPICRRSLQSGDAPADQQPELNPQSTASAANNSADTNIRNTAPRLGQMSRTIIRGLRPHLQLLSELPSLSSVHVSDGRPSLSSVHVSDTLPSLSSVHVSGARPAAALSSGSLTSGSSVSSGGAWTPRSANSTNTSDSSVSMNSNDVDRTSSYNMDLDFD